MTGGQKHLIRCMCILSQYKKMTDPPQHHFVVFSELDDEGEAKIKYVQCNNCSIIHKITGLCRSEILMGKENFSLVSIDDIKLSLSEKIVKILEKYDADLPTWEAVKFIVDNQNWGDVVTLTSDSDGEMLQGKYIQILGENLLKIETFVREEIVK